jgi:AraC-like DNA-binding protein
MTEVSLSYSFDTVQSVAAGSIVYPRSGRFGPRIQQDLQLVLLYTGEMDVTIDDQLLHVEPGHVILLKPGHEEFFTFSKTEETWHRWIAVHVSPLSKITLDALYRMPVCLPLTEEMNRITELILNMQSHRSADDPVIRSLGLAALHLFPTDSATMRGQREKHPAVYQAISWIRDHFAEEIRLRDMAFHAGLSPEHLLRLFKQHENTTPIQYVWRYRVERAIEMLSHTGLNITEIAQRCGFKTSHHFARMIKQETGRTPSGIRETSWNGSIR